MHHAIRRALVPSLEILLFVLVLYVSLFFMPDMLNSDGDLGRHIAVGNYILDHRAIPTRDVFSHTRLSAELVLHEWLSEVLYALAHRAAGLNGAAWLTAVLLALTYALLCGGLRVLGVGAPLAVLATLAAYLTGAIHHLPRPHLFSLLCFTLCLLFIELYRRKERNFLLLLLLPVTVLWANLNGAFVLVFFVLAIYAAGAWLDRERRRAVIFLLTLAGCGVACLVNPFGIGLPQHVFGFMGNRFLVDITVEYLSPNFHNISAWFFAAWILFSIFLFGRHKERASWTHLMLLGAWTAFGLYSARNIANYGVVAALVTAPVAQAYLAANRPGLGIRLENLDRAAPIAGGWIWGMMATALLVALQWNGATFDARGEGNVLTSRAFPVGAVDFIERNAALTGTNASAPVAGNVFNEYTWGGYLEYRLFPRVRVFIDGDNDFFGEELVREYLDVIHAREGWDEILERYQVRWVLVPPERPLARALKQSGVWNEAYRDEYAVIWVRAE
jgi:hypothetical protein